MFDGHPFIFLLFQVIFWLCVAIIFYSYVLFPLIIRLLAAPKRFLLATYNYSDKLPFVSILISAYNEEEVIGQKIESIFKTRYPKDKFEVLVGSDASDDKTNSILSGLQQKYSSLRFFPFKQRRGKGNVINDLYNYSTGDIIILTDANVMLDQDTVYELAKYFKDDQVGLVDSHMINTHIHPDGISHQEKSYIAREVSIKQHESILWGTMMGPFGGCFALRRNLYEPVPKNFLVDDFFINMKVLEKGYKCVNNLDARVYEDVSNNLKDEYRRKVRISTGNFQNLRHFSHLLWHKTKGLSFCFISHKALRWIGPFLLLFAFVSNLILSIHSRVYFFIFILHCFLFLLPLSDLLLKRLGMNIAVLRFITHFYSMNLALLTGFFKTFKNIESNVWKPTKRNQA